MILSQTLIIHKFPILFNILFELKKNLNFNIKRIDNNQIPETFDKKNLLIISGSENFDFENQIKIDNYPINLEKLIEVINIQFIKIKFNQQNSIKAGKYYINLNSRRIYDDNNSLSLTEKEIKIISFLNTSDKPITINELQIKVWGHKSKLETHTVETHVYRLRKKIQKIFKDNSFILSLKNGYKIQK